jgi:2-dehydro-3-deoxy-D-gluconate 5-dehydrogenase
MTWGPFDLTGKRAVVTGGAMGIGYGIVTRLAEAGADVLVADLDGELAESKAAASSESGGKVLAEQVDVSAADAGDLLVAAAAERLGGIDILVNNAGIYPQVPMLEMERAVWEKILAVNLTGLAFVSRAVGRRMVEQGTGGAIVNIASIDALHPSMVGLAAYDASKGGVLMFTKSLALELAPHGVRVNAIAPGGIATEGASRPLEGSGLTPEQMEAMVAAFMEKIPLKRMGTPDDIATAAVFLASDAAGYVTGELLVVDGGTLLS